MVFRARSRTSGAVGGSGGTVVIVPTGDVNAQVNVNPAIAISTVNSGTLVKPEVKPGFAVTQTPATLLVDQKPAVAISLLPTTGDVAKPAVNPALALTTLMSGTLQEDKPAVNIVQVVYSLVRRVGGNASADITGTWTNRANAEGIHNASSATSAGGVGAVTRKMRVDYADSVNKGELVITAAVLNVYISVTGDATGLLSDVNISYNIGAGETLLEAIAGNFNSLSTPRQYNLFALGLDTWAEYDALQAFVEHIAATASTGVTCSVDAIEIEITAAVTDTL